MKQKDKWKFAIGTTSRIPGESGFHYLIADFDTKLIDIVAMTLVVHHAHGRCIWQETRHGWHLYTNLVGTLEGITSSLKSIQADPAWIRIGEKRGYFFLADKSQIDFPWPVEHMVIHYGKEKT